MIEQLTKTLWLLASHQDSFRVWGRFDNGKPVLGAEHYLAICGGLAIVSAIALVWQRLSKRRQREFYANSPSQLFRDLCRAHRLPRASKRLLKQLAAERVLDTPATLFVEPEYFDASNLPPRMTSSAQELRQLRTKLFR